MRMWRGSRGITCRWVTLPAPPCSVPEQVAASQQVAPSSPASPSQMVTPALSAETMGAGIFRRLRSGWAVSDGEVGDKTGGAPRLGHLGHGDLVPAGFRGVQCGFRSAVARRLRRCCDDTLSRQSVSSRLLSRCSGPVVLGWLMCLVFCRTHTGQAHRKLPLCFSQSPRSLPSYDYR